MRAATAGDNVEGEPVMVDARSDTQKLGTLAKLNTETERGGGRVARHDG